MIGVVFPSYRIPEHRLRDHFAWNERFYREGVRVFAVTDKQYDVPPYAKCVVFPEEQLPLIDGMRVFATTRCRNAGIRTAIGANCDPIIVTDVDISFEPVAWRAMLTVTESKMPTAQIPYCRMSETNDWYSRHNLPSVFAPKATGTISMRSVDWGRVSYCEEQWAYGCDDGLIMTRIANAGIRIQRAGEIYHMAHVDGSCQKEFDGRDDHWNRANGFNPDNFQHNLKF
jgi:hypothetical protein